METLVSASIAAIVLSAVVLSYLFFHRMYGNIMAESEMSLIQREIRDKLLFHAGPGLNSGLLTGKASADSASLTMNWATISGDPDINSPDKIRLVWRTAGTDPGHLFNERMPHDALNIGWFKPRSYFTMQHDWTYAVNLPRINVSVKNSRVETAQSTTCILLPQ
jgi:hypothetical protein